MLSRKSGEHLNTFSFLDITWSDEQQDKFQLYVMWRTLLFGSFFFFSVKVACSFIWRWQKAIWTHEAGEDEMHDFSFTVLTHS